MRAIHITR